MAQYTTGEVWIAKYAKEGEKRETKLRRREREDAKGGGAKRLSLFVL
jgi:hypothetical protein